MKALGQARPTRLAWIAAVFLGACAGPLAPAGSMNIFVEVDGAARSVELPAGSTSAQALQVAAVELGSLDRVDPPGYTVLTEGSTVRVVRVIERFEIETVTLPFERQTIRNEALPQGETRLLQAGENGVQEITYRIVEEGGVESSRVPAQVVVVIEPRPEIVMIGAQAAYTPVPIEGTLAFVSGGNAWLLSGDSGNRRPLVVTGDLDSRILRLSPDSRWLLFSRQAEDLEQGINSLWVISTVDPEAEEFSLGVENVVHFADWSPSSAATIAYSTVEPRPAAPGWQANNDLSLVTFGTTQHSGRVTQRRAVLPANAGGQYGWWGTMFVWAGDGIQIAYSRPDSVGVVDLRRPEFSPWSEFVPYQTRGDWAWLPGVTWGQDHRTLFLVHHGAPVGLESAAASPVFDVVALTGPEASGLELAGRSGMFAAPAVSPPQVLASGEVAYYLGFLQALSPLESEESGYALAVVDRDGSNLQRLFPPSGEPGLEAQQPIWSPSGDRLAVIYRGDLWIVDRATGIGQRVTGDGQTTALDWKP
jgi:hypothetical protein